MCNAQLCSERTREFASRYGKVLYDTVGFLCTVIVIIGTNMQIENPYKVRICNT